MKIAIIPRWLESMQDELHLTDADMLDVNKLLDILSIDDVCFYIILQNMADVLLPYDFINNFPTITINTDDIADKQTERALWDRVQVAAAQLKDGDTLGLFFDGPGTETIQKVTTTKGYVNLEIDADNSIDDVLIAHPSYDNTSLQTVQYYGAAHKAALGYTRLEDLATYSSFFSYEKLLYREVVHGHRQ